MKNRLRFAEKVAGVSALALLGFLFLDWFEPAQIAVVASGTEFTPIDTLDLPFYAEGVSGWDSLGCVALALCVAAIVVGLALPLVFVLFESPVLPVFAAIVAMLVGGLAVIALLVQIIFQPGDDATTQVLSGWWLGLLAAAGVARGGFLSMRDEYLPGVPMPDVPVRPAPPAAPAA